MNHSENKRSTFIWEWEKLEVSLNVCGKWTKAENWKMLENRNVQAHNSSGVGYLLADYEADDAAREILFLPPL